MARRERKQRGQADAGVGSAHLAKAGLDAGAVLGAGHTQGLATAPRAWEARVTGFLDAALGP